MALAPFFSRAYSAVGAHLGITREELEKILTGRIVGIHLCEACASEGNEKWIAELLVNLLSRLYPSLSISGDDSAKKNLSEIARAINPTIEISDNLDQADIFVSVGGPAKNSKGFSASASGWVARIGNNYCSGPDNPYSAGAAAALASWRVFQVVFDKDATGKTKVLPDTSLSLLDYGFDSGESEVLPTVDLGEVAVVGIGAVGNPAIWAWARHKELKGKLHLIDYENIELSNLQRYCLTSLKDEGKSKVKLAERELRNSELKMRRWSCRVEDFAQKFKSIGKLPTICVSVDNVDGRRTAQALLPRLVINGWTSENGLGASWHRFLGNQACLACLYHPKGMSLSQTELAAQALGLPHDQLALLWVSEKPLGEDEVKQIESHLNLSEGQLAVWAGKRVQDIYTGVICGQIGIDLKAIGRVATVPLAHQSVLAGIFMAAELIKRSTEELEVKSQQEPLILWDDVMRHPPMHWIVNRRKNSECFCGDELYQLVYEEKWGSSK